MIDVKKIVVIVGGWIGVRRQRVILHIVGGAYSGLRYYRFGADTMPRGRLKTFFAPHFISAGMLFTGATDRALISPFENGMRTGGFLEWGAARIGATLGHDWRVVIGVGNQILPYVF